MASTKRSRSRSLVQVASMMSQGVSTSQLHDLSQWSCRPATLHQNHGRNIRLSDNDSVAERLGPRNTMIIDGGLVFTAEPVPLDCVLRVTVLKTQAIWPGSFSMGFTVVNPAECTVAEDAEFYLSSSKHWTIYMGRIPRKLGMHHNGLQKTGLPDTNLLVSDESAAIAVDSKRNLHFFYKDKHASVVCSELPMKQLWGFVDVYGKAEKVKVEILHSGEQSPDTTHLLASQQRAELSRTREQLALQEQLAQTRQQEVHRLQQQLSQQQQNRQQLQQKLSQQQQAMQQLQRRHDIDQAEIQQLRFQARHDEIQKVEFWQVPRQDVQVFEDKVLGRGGWGFVAEGKFRGQRVAVKRIYSDILRPLTLDRIRREISTMAQVRHPNLVLFIASVLDDKEGPMIITEILDLSLRKAYEEVRLGSNKLRIFHDVAAALNYLHRHREPIIHRDVSTANVLLEAMANNIWKAKLSDFGSANLARLATTLGEGAIVYTAPEAYPHPPNSPNPRLPQTFKIDVYSYGVLLCEVITAQFPSPDNFQSMVEEISRQWPLMHTLICDSTKYNPDERPTMATILEEIDKAHLECSRFI